MMPATDDVDVDDVDEWPRWRLVSRRIFEVQKLLMRKNFIRDGKHYLAPLIHKAMVDCEGTFTGPCNDDAVLDHAEYLAAVTEFLIRRELAQFNADFAKWIARHEVCEIWDRRRGRRYVLEVQKAGKWQL
jgi:hypothetical protein